MANKQISMQKIRQVLRCYAQGKGTKAMSSIVCSACPATPLKSTFKSSRLWI